MTTFSRLRTLPHDYPILRGMGAYAVLWPLSSILQQSFRDKSEPVDWSRAFRFGLIGSCFTAPTLFLWVRISSRIFPGKDIGTAVKKAVVEQITYGPTALCGFFFGISALEGKPFQECVSEVKQKFLPTFKVGICVWPVVQTVNNYLVPEKNRVVVVSLLSIMWTCFLSYMKSLESAQKEDTSVERNKS